MTIYTKKGDAGETGLGDNRRVQKTDPRIEAVGSIDELNSAIGLGISFLPPQSTLKEPLNEIQHALLTVGSRLALPSDAEPKYASRVPTLDPKLITNMETSIDTWWAAMPELTNFILPGGTPAAAALHVARATSRRTERTVLRLRTVKVTVDPTIAQFLNRLSDFLFCAARMANYEQKVSDIIWHK